MNGRNWTTEEDMILITNSDKTLNELSKLLPIRTVSSIKNRYFKLGLTKKNYPPWSNEEDNILKKYYQKIGGKVSKKLPNRSIREIYNRANMLGIHYNRKWTCNEYKLLRDFYCSNDPNIDIFSMIPDASMSAIYSKANYLKINRTHRWTDKEIDILKKNYPKIGIKVQSLLKGRSKRAISAKVSVLGLKVNRK